MLSWTIKYQISTHLCICSLHISGSTSMFIDLANFLIRIGLSMQFGAPVAFVQQYSNFLNPRAKFCSLKQEPSTGNFLYLIHQLVEEERERKNWWLATSAVVVKILCGKRLFTYTAIVDNTSSATQLLWHSLLLLNSSCANTSSVT